MTDLTPRLVWGIDVTVTAVHLARITEGDPKPGTGVVPVTGDGGAVHTVASTHHKLVTAADTAVAAVLSKGAPALVTMSKFMWNDMRADPSAGRRAHLWWTIAERLLDAGVPVGEFPLPTLTTWSRGGAGKSTGKMLDAQANTAKALWPDIEPPANHRAGTVLLAAAGAMAVGISTPVAATQDRLNILSGYDGPAERHRSNQSIQWPAARKPPRTVEAWKALHENGVPADPTEDDSAA